MNWVALALAAVCVCVESLAAAAAVSVLRMPGKTSAEKRSAASALYAHLCKDLSPFGEQVLQALEDSKEQKAVDDVSWIVVRHVESTTLTWRVRDFRRAPRMDGRTGCPAPAP